MARIDSNSKWLVGFQREGSGPQKVKVYLSDRQRAEGLSRSAGILSKVLNTRRAGKSYVRLLCVYETG